LQLDAQELNLAVALGDGSLAFMHDLLDVQALLLESLLAPLRRLDAIWALAVAWWELFRHF